MDIGGSKIAQALEWFGADSGALPRVLESRGCWGYHLSFALSVVFFVLRLFFSFLLFLGANEPGKERDKPPTGAVWADFILPQKEFARTVTWSVVSAELHAQSTPSSS